MTETPPSLERRQSPYPPIRMLHVITRLVRGGADENTIDTVRGLDKRRYEVDLAVGEGSDPELVKSLDPVCVHMIHALTRDPHPVKDVIALFQLAALMRRGHYQIVHTHTAKGGFLGRLAAAMVGAPIVIHTVHGVTFHEHLKPWTRAFYLTLERIAARFTHQFVAVGEDVRLKYVREGIGQASAYETIYSGMPLRDYLEAGQMSDRQRDALRKELGFGPEHRVIVMAARLEERKGHGYLFEAIRRLAPDHPGLRLLVLGDGPLLAALQQQCRELGIAKRVSFLGHRHDLPRVLAASDISVLTSLWEGLPRVLVQSAAVGRPILTFDVEGAWEVVRDGRNGYVVPTRDVDAFTKRLDMLVREREKSRALGDAGRAQIGDRWTVETMLERLDDLYQRWAAKDVA